MPLPTFRWKSKWNDFVISYRHGWWHWSVAVWVLGVTFLPLGGRGASPGPQLQIYNGSRGSPSDTQRQVPLPVAIFHSGYRSWCSYFPPQTIFVHLQYIQCTNTKYRLKTRGLRHLDIFGDARTKLMNFCIRAACCSFLLALSQAQVANQCAATCLKGDAGL